jgi:hypothetical protein
MTNDLDEVTARLSACLDVVTSTVPDEAPPWDASRRPSPFPAPQRSLRPGKSALVVVVVGAVAAASVAMILLWPRGTVRADLISATARTIGAQTARVRLTSVPSAGLQEGEHAVAMTATGVVDFSTPAIRASYPDGYSWVQVGRRSWQTVWPPASSAPTWERTPATRVPQGRTAAERALEGALEPDTGPSALLAALRSGTDSFHELGVATVRGLEARHYRATIATDWEADVWVGDGRLVQVEVRTPDGSTTVDYYDFGTPVAIVPPPVRVVS